MRRIGCLLVTLCLLTACSRPTATPPAAPPAPSAGQPAGRADGPKAESILPPAGQVMNYHLSDEADTVAESFVRDGERLTGTQNGTPYLTWFITDQGIYRQEPKGRVLLRYLPPVLVAGTAWRQPGSSGTDVWFRLRQNPCVPKPADSCWELTVLNGSTRSQFQFAEGSGVVWAAAEDPSNPAGSFEKVLVNGATPPAPEAAAIIKQMPTRPDGPLPTVTPVALADFAAFESAWLADAGLLLAQDLDNDGRPERIEGRLGEWTAGPLILYDDDGRRLPVPYGALDPGRRQKLTVGKVAGRDRPALILQVGRHPDGWHQIVPMWLYPDGFHRVLGWQPKIEAMWSGDAWVEPDGTLVFTGLPHLMGGYQWTKRYRLKQDGEQYRPEQIAEQMTAGSYPTTPDGLLTAAIIARGWNLTADLPRYIPDEAVQKSFLAARLGTSSYAPNPVETGQVTYRENGYPIVAAAPLAPDGSTEFLLWNGAYEGATYYAGKVQFGRAADGRLIITALTITKSAFCYDKCDP